MGKTLEHTKSTNENKKQNHKKQYTQTIFRDWCKACGICSAFCPRKVIGVDEGGGPEIVDPDSCIGCRFCELHCPDFAITIMDRDVKKEENGE